MLEKVTYADVWRYTLSYWGQQKKYWPLLLCGLGLAAFMDSIFPVITGKLVNTIIATDFAAGDSLKPVLVIFGAFVLIDVFYHSIRNGTIFIWNIVAVRFLYAILNDSYTKVQRFSSDWHANNFSGGTVRKITRGMASFDVYEDILFMYLYPTAMILIFTVAIMTWHWPVMGLITLLSVLTYVGFSIFTVAVINAPGFKESARRDTAVGAALADSITANSVIKAHGREQAEQERFAGVVMHWRLAAFRAWKIAITTDLLRRYLSIGMMAAMVGGAIWLWSKGQARPGDVVYVFTANMILNNYLRHIGEQMANMQKAIAEMEDSIWYWKTDIAIKDRPGANPLAPGKGEIVFDAVRFAYKNLENPLFDGLSVRIAPGEKVALVGHSGSGKSSFVKLVQRLYDIQGGAILIDSQNIADVTQDSLRRSIALVPQEPILFHRTLEENIAYGKPGASREEIIHATQQAYAHDFILRLPDGYATMVGERGLKLSGGERQRVAIARAILSDAPILILDEATSSLDSVSEHYIQMALANLSKGRTSVTIAHRLATIKAVDRILVFENGKIVEQGTHANLIANPHSRYKTLYDMQALDLIGE